MLIALLAAGAMVLQDILGTIMVQLEAGSLSLPRRKTWRDYVGGGWRAWGSALLDQMQWMVAITTTTISVEAFSGHDVHLKVIVFVAVSIANLIGSRTGQELGIWLLRRRGKTFVSVEDRLTALENIASSPEGRHGG
jgi:hypothetical protein